MQIPVGNFGNAIAQPGPVANVSSDDPIGAASQRVGGIAQSVTNDVAAQNRQRQEEAKRASAALTLATTTNAMHDAHDEVARGVMDGSIPVDKASGELSQRVAKIRDATVSSFSDPAQRDTMAAHVVDTQGTLQRSLTGVVVKRQQHDAAASIDDFGEQMQRTALRTGPASAVASYTSYVHNTAPAAGLDEHSQQKLIQGFTEKTHADFYTNAGVAALTKGDDVALGNLIQQVSGPAGDAMDPQRRAIVTHTLFGWQQHILAQRDRAANQADEEGRRQYNAAVEIFNKGTDIALSGGYLSPDFIQTMVTTAQGTEMAPRVQALISSQRAVAGFASRPADERAAMIERARAERADPAKGTDPLGDKLLTAMSTMDEKLRRQADENPWAAAQSAGVIKDAPAFNLADPATAVQAIQSRMQQISTVENWTGKRVSPLQPQEVEQVAKFVRQLPLDQASTLLSNIGAALDDGDRVAALGKQLHDKDGALGIAMMYASAQTTEGRRTAELVLRGDQALKDNTALVDKSKETGWQATIAKSIRGAYSNREAEDTVVDAAFKIAVANYADGKGADLDNAVRLATGGIVERNGQKIPLPYGMSERDFDKRVEAIRPPDLAGQAPGGQVFVGRTPMPVDQFVATLPKATLVHAGQGVYAVRAGTSLVTNGAGKPITLRIAP